MHILKVAASMITVQPFPLFRLGGSKVLFTVGAEEISSPRNRAG